MSIWRRLAGQFVTPVDRPPAVDVPLAALLEETPPATEPESELEARHKAVRRLVHRTLVAESLKDPGLRNLALLDFCLEIRTALRPSAPGSEVLREVPPVGIRYAAGGYAAPVIPGRAA